MKKLVIIFGLIPFLFACKKEDEKFTPISVNEGSTTATVSLGSSYGNQVFYSLSSKKIVATNQTNDWDIRYTDGGDIIMNGALYYSAASTTKDLSQITDTIGMDFKHDYPSYESSKLAITDLSLNYVLHREKDVSLFKLGFTVNSGTLAITVSSLDGTNAKNFDLNIGEELSFTNGAMSLFPNPDSWDIMFTQYTHIFEDDTPYLVTGALINHERWTGAELNNNNYAEVDLSDINNATLEANANTLGYDWKTYDFDAGSYTVDQNRIFALMNSAGDTYKFHFLDFYDNNGTKGSPKFEFEKL